MRPRVVAIVRTCPACPSQWEGRTADGRAVYVRYRWGTLRVGFGATIAAAVAADAPLTFSVELGGPLDGRLSYAELVAAVPFVDWPPIDEGAE